MLFARVFSKDLKWGFTPKKLLSYPFILFTVSSSLKNNKTEEEAKNYMKTFFDYVCVVKSEEDFLNRWNEGINW